MTISHRALIALPLLFAARMFGQTSDTIFHYAGQYQNRGFSGDGGPATAAQINGPTALSHDSKGNIYFFDGGNYRIRKVDAGTGVITTYAGNGSAPGNVAGDLPGDGGPATAAVVSSYALAFDASDNLFILGGDPASIRKVDAKTGIITTAAKPSLPGLAYALGLSPFAVNSAGTSAFFLLGTVVLEASLTTSATTLFAGGGTASKASGDGVPAATATLGIISAVACDNTGNAFILAAAPGQNLGSFGGVYIAAVRKIDTQGIVSTVFTIPAANYVSFLALDNAGNLFLASQSMVFKAGQGAASWTHIAGSGGPPTGKMFVDGSYAVDVPIFLLASLTLDPAGNLYYVDSGSGIIAKILDVGSTATAPGVATIVSAASSLVEPLAPGSIATAYAPDLANGTAGAAQLPLPMQLAGTTGTVTDASGVTTPLSFFFVSPTQINFLIPSGLPTGAATVSFTSGDGSVSNGAITLSAISPAIFVLNSDALAAANVITANRDGSVSTTNDFQVSNGALVASPINLGPPAQAVYLVLYGTGISGLSSVANATLNVQNSTLTVNENLPVAYAGPQGGVGLDQVNVELPLFLAGLGTLKITLIVDGIASNTVTTAVQ